MDIFTIFTKNIYIFVIPLHLEVLVITFHFP